MSYKDYIQFTKREKRGILVLSVLLILVLFLPKIYGLFNQEEIKSKEELLQEIEVFQESLVLKEKNEKGKFEKQHGQTANKKNFSKDEADQYIPIDVNTATIKDWIQLGFSKKQAQVIVKYIKKAKPITSLKQLEKIYVVDKQKLKKIQAYLILHVEDTEIENSVQEDSTNELIEKKFELNSIDSLQLVSIGIPEFLANRIVKYRNLLGGFYAIEQMKEVYGMNDEVMQILSQHHLDTTKIYTINLNTADFKTINKHPYITYEITKKIFNYRKIMERITSLDELTKNKILNSEQLIRIEPYIAIED